MVVQASAGDPSYKGVWGHAISSVLKGQKNEKMPSAKLTSSAWTPCCFVRLCVRLGTIKLKCPRHSTTFARTFGQILNMESIHTSNPVKMCSTPLEIGKRMRYKLL